MCSLPQPRHPGALSPDDSCPSPLPPPVWYPMLYLVFKEGLNSKLEAVSHPFSILPDVEGQQAAEGDHAGGHGQPERGHAHIDLCCWGWRGLLDKSKVGRDMKAQHPTVEPPMPQLLWGLHRGWREEMAAQGWPRATTPWILTPPVISPRREDKPKRMWTHNVQSTIQASGSQPWQCYSPGGIW